MALRPRLACLRALLVAAALFLAGPAGAGELTVEVLDIGQGDSILLTTPDGKLVLVDGGPPDAGEKIAKLLASRGITSLDLMVITHPHLDHLGGLLEVVRQAPPKLVLDPGIDHPLPQYSELLKELERRKIPVKLATAGRKLELGNEVTATLLGPPEPHLAGTRSDVNSNSTVMKVQHGKVSFLLVGDAEPETERALLASHADLDADVLKVGHHGGRYSSTAAFLAAVSPRLAVISCGAGNDYGHPTRDAMDRIRAAGGDILRTDLDGTVKVVSDGQRVRAFAEKDGTSAPPSVERPREPRSSGASPAAGRPGKAEATSAPFLASSRSKSYHSSGCDGAARINAKNLVGYASAADAEAAGKKPAGDCLGDGGSKKRRTR